MVRRLPASLVLTLAFLLVLVASLIAGALLVRSILTTSFANAERIRATRILVGDALRAQLDEETGVRGYAVVRDAVLLEPYYEGRATLPQFLDRIGVASKKLHLDEALPKLADARQTNRRWLRRFAYPTIVSKKRGHVLELHSKVLVDRFRDDMLAIDAALAGREMAGDARAQRAIAWANFFALAAVLAVVAAAALFTVGQYRLAARLEQQRVEAERQERRAAAIRAAYETEKRIADTLQEAFAQRVLPEPPSVRLSATYVPATEEAKVGGDWYDAVELSQDRVLLAIGDVAGHGIDAAVAMNAARQMLISSALIDPTPGKILERVNKGLFAGEAPMITAIAGVLDARTCEFAYAAAGHPAPVLLEPGLRARFLESGSLPLGIDPNAAYATHVVRSMPGAILVLYTDGAIEYSRNVVEGETLLLLAVENAALASGDDPARAIHDAIFDRHRVSDDVAILTIHFLEPTAAVISASSALRRTA